MTSSNGLPCIKRLKSRKYFDSWKFAVQALMEHKGLWEYVKNKVKAENIGPAKAIKAKAKSVLLVEPVNYVHINTAETAAEVWKKLCSAFEDSG